MYNCQHCHRTLVGFRTHTDDCPILTGVFKYDVGVVRSRCGICSDDFLPGDLYMKDERSKTDLSRGICLGCMAIKEIIIKEESK